ncbi:hypothetical protein [Naasia aerilata]|uniref:Uncharacterized protein n=1 Tax=Naasia aerilata TaxID=1162966 RepID=A0ABM8GBZ2_9MICO|nr:hypothetical protein [Naasia aerilata]BDZ45743.1 hypothetical protein GCM10025866_16520 [Naasia aerilata]
MLGTRVKFLARVDVPEGAPSAVAARTGSTTSSTVRNEPQRYGEAVVREILGASFIEETAIPPRGRE